MASTGRIVFSLLIAAVGATVVGMIIASRPQTDPMTTGSTRASAYESAPVPRRTTSAPDRSAPSPEEVRAFFEAHIRQVRQR